VSSLQRPPQKISVPIFRPLQCSTELRQITSLSSSLPGRRRATEYHPCRPQPIGSRLGFVCGRLQTHADEPIQIDTTEAATDTIDASPRTALALPPPPPGSSWSPVYPLPSCSMTIPPAPRPINPQRVPLNDRPRKIPRALNLRMKSLCSSIVTSVDFPQRVPQLLQQWRG
jgi:hypothetical protein